MTSDSKGKNSNDLEDDQSTDTHSLTGGARTINSKTSAEYLDRIKEETDRIRRKRAERSSSEGEERPFSVVAEGSAIHPNYNINNISSLGDSSFDASIGGQPSSQPTSPKKYYNSWNVDDDKKGTETTRVEVGLKSNGRSHQRNTALLRLDSLHRLDSDIAVNNSVSEELVITQNEESSPGENSKEFFEVSFRTIKSDHSNNNSNNSSVEESPRKANSIFSLRFAKSSDTMATDAQKENEDFRNKLIDEVLGTESGEKVPMEKVMMIIWQFRDDKDVIKFMTRFVAKFAGYRDVFEGIEFYLPQLAHMIIHLETEWDDAILERFSLVIAQQSIHFALQLNWILVGAIEDYQPELPDGTSNPTHNPLYYVRCVKLLTNIERCVVYRTARSRELQRLYEKGLVTKTEMHSMEQADRRFTAMEITQVAPVKDDYEVFGGTLMYKRAVRTSCFKFKRWKRRYFAIEERMLNCYNTEGGTLVRSMPLDGATVQAMSINKYENMFSVTNRSFEFRMRASSQEDRNKWIKMLESEANTHRVFGHTDSALSLNANNEDAQRVIDELTPSQRDRYLFYRHERDFVRRLTDIAEDLRFLEPADRKKNAPGLMKTLEIPPSSYSPLMSSTDIFRRIHSTLWEDTRVFNTKERCPTVMYFLGVRGELVYNGERHANMDIAEYIHLKFDSKLEDRDAKMTTKTMENGQEILEVEMRTHPRLSEEREKIVVKKTVRTVDEVDEHKEDDGSALVTPTKGVSDADIDRQSMVWSGSFTDQHGEATPQKPSKGKGSPVRANRQLKRFLRESMISVPRKLAHHLERKHSRHTEEILVDDVPIATGKHVLSGSHGLGKGVYVGRSSVMDQNKILIGKSGAGDIDQESMNRAREIVCGGETWAEKSFRMLEGIKNKPEDKEVQLEIVCLLSKSNDDLRQEVFVMQMIHYYKSVFIAADLPLWLKTYKILSTSASTGLLEFNQDSTSLDGLKKSEHYPKEGGLRKYYENTYGGPDSVSFKAAQRNFMQSLAGYSVVCYLLGLKDRHNGNIMIDMYGHMIHIDYGFCMGMCVGHELTLERAPFKFTQEYVDVMGGIDSECYKEFVRLFVEGMMEARNKCHIALGLVEIMMYKSNYPCFSGRRYGGGQALRGFRERLMLDIPDELAERKAKDLIKKARDHWGTRAYDSFQQWSNGYAM
mmetsp:Transcript_3576/g.8610  ORF Transcript_3576/g.8610 Transcript_3576/m.8610 type:complete len:1175 (-) Transcript_3576:71-3595(-)|eukprot:CAMPEP_0172395998 /NCGR_PEP_ID=MMETSP1061-20121228/22926_1 /TAXON_ID=37318 /ORGANISM="Pseudo-nitzschia pungens, Strain cf. pungens" /LENGTH=1174 /DNA_ID=CAMNT_0013127743 /DNA_START=226 /DNA_END=3750 /DNA_ORIENTATION=-